MPVSEKKIDIPFSDLKIPKGYRFYRIKGVDKPIIARKGGPNTEEVKTKPSYKELRNNQKEFGTSSMIAKLLRQSLSKVMLKICGAYVSGRLTAQFRNLAKLEDGNTGERPIFLSKHGYLLNGFDFNQSAPYKDTFKARYFVRLGSKPGQVILHFPAFIPSEVFKTPKHTTNFKIMARLIILSDYKFDKFSGYQPANKEVNGKYGTYESSMLPMLKIPIEPMTEHISVPIQTISEASGLILIMAVSFYQYANGKFEHLYKSSCMQIQQVW